MRRVTLSALPRYAECLYPLDDRAVWRDDPPGEAATNGTAVHAAIESYVLGKRVDLDGVPGEMFAAWRMWVAEDPTRADGDPEVAFAYRAGVVTRIKGAGHRDYAASPDGAICGTLDLVDEDEEGRRVIVTDWKTTTGPDSSAAPIEQNRQLWAGGAMAARFYGRTAATIRLVVISPERVTMRSYTMTDLDIQATLDGLDALADANASGGPHEPHPGSHCGWCPARAECPALVAGAALVTTEARTTLDLVTGPGIAEARAILKRVREAADEADERIRARVTECGGSLDLGNGKALRISSAARESIAWSPEDKQRARAAGQVRTSSYEVMKEIKA